MNINRDKFTEISALADHEDNLLTVDDIDADTIKWLTIINKMSHTIVDLEVPDPIDVDALISDFMQEISNDTIYRFFTAKF